MPISATPKDGPDWTNLATIIRQNGTVLTLGSRNDYLAQLTVTAGTTTVVNATVPAAKVKTDYSEVVVQYTGDTAHPQPLCVVVYTAQSLSTLQSSRVAPFGSRPETTANPWQALVPVPAGRNSEIVVKVYFSGTGAKGRLNVWGDTGRSGVQLRSDGRTYPIGSHKFAKFWTSTTVQTLIAAPTSPLRILIKEATFLAETGALVTADSGTTHIAYSAFSAPTKITNTLLPAAAALTASLNLSRPTLAFGTYDLVV